MPRAVKYDDTISFECPGCGYGHAISVAPGRWTWNGDLERPTFQPSVLTTGVEPRCHSFVTEGRIRFLGDSTHALAGQTVDLPEIDW